MSALRVTFWGVRDAFPAIGADFAHYGGDTSCIEVETQDARVALDAGTGLRNLVRTRGAPSHIALSSLRLDRVQGLPDITATLIAPLAASRTLRTLLSPPLTQHMGDLTLQDIDAAAPLAPSTTIQAHEFEHAIVLVVQTLTRKLVYVTQSATARATVIHDIAAVAHGANLLIVNAAHSDTDNQLHGFTWQDAVRLKQEAGAALLAITGHHPDRTDAELARIAGDAGARFPNVFFARTGCQLDL